ncbi:MAG: glycine cleavage system protein GcvH [Anaerolineaceae bacterium]|nr:glycine cleavage system protein GcvH [Anaerolineaceae bacterium]
MGNANPADLKYTKNDEWVRLEDGTATIGVTDYAQEQLNDIVYVELPDVGAKFDQGDSFGVVESVKAASDIYTAVGGTVSAVNNALEDQPELINNDPYGEGWLVKITVAEGDLSDLMDAAAYTAFCESR